MKLDPTVKKETLYLILGETILTVLMLAVFLIIGTFDLTVLAGALISAALAVANFFAMCLTIQKALNTAEEDRAKMIRASHSTRLLLIALVIVICLAVLKLNIFATLIPLLFPQIVQLVRGLMIKKENPNDLT